MTHHYLIFGIKKKNQSAFPITFQVCLILRKNFLIITNFFVYAPWHFMKNNFIINIYLVIIFQYSSIKKPPIW